MQTINAFATTGVILPDGQLRLDGLLPLSAGRVRVIVEAIPFAELPETPWAELQKTWDEQRAHFFVQVANQAPEALNVLLPETSRDHRHTDGLPLLASDLRDFMSQISEDCYCAGWLVNLEFDLWTAVMNGPVRAGHWDITQTDIDRLRLLARRCDGWVVWDHQRKQETWVSIQDWLGQYKKHMATKTA